MASVGVTRIEEKYYLKNGLRAFAMLLRKKLSEEYLSLAGKLVELILFDELGEESFRWSSAEGSEHLLILEPDGITGKVSFPEINQWKIPAGIHKGDLDIYDLADNSFLQTYRTFEFEVVQNVPKPD